MQENCWRCPLHESDFQYVCVKLDCNLSQRILCKICVSQNNGGSLDNLKQLQDVLKEMQEHSVQFKNIMKSKEMCIKEMNRIQSKFNGIFESQPYWSIQIDSSLKLQDLRQLVHNYCQSKFKDVDQLQYNLRSWQSEAQKVLGFADEINCQLRCIQTELIKKIDNGPIKFKELKRINNIPGFNLIEPNFDENNFLIAQEQFICMMYMENDQLIQKDFIEGKQNCKITCLIKEKGIRSNIVVGYKNGYFQVWEQASDGIYRCYHEKQDYYNSSITAMILGQNNNMLITQSEFKIHCWQFNNKQWIQTQSWEDQNLKITQFCLNLNYSLLAAVINDKIISISRLNQQKQWNPVFQQSFEEKIEEICFIHDDNFVICFNGVRYVNIYQLNFENLMLNQSHKIELDFLYTNCQVKIKPKFYKEIGLLLFQTDQETFLIKQNKKQQYEKFQLGNKKMQKIRFINFGQHIVYFQDEPSNQDSKLLIVAKTELQ